MWGDTGRYPLVIKNSPKVFNYLNRLESMEASESEALVRHAFTEQKKLGLSVKLLYITNYVFPRALLYKRMT